MGNQPGRLQTHTQIGRPKKAVHWKSAERPSPPGRPILTTLSEQQADVVNLRWDRPMLDGGSPITGYVIEHRRMGSPHWVRATPTPIPNCEVSLSGLEPGWRYQFRAFAENIVGRSDPSELSDALTVTLQRNAITVPRFIDELLDMNATEDERIEFRVRVLGEPPPEINWFKDGYEIFSSRRTKIVNDNDVSVLIIHQVALTDEGEIKCTATNRAGHVVTKAQLLVQAPPKIRLPRTYEDGIIVEAEEVLRLKVGIAGQPPPVITWLHEGEVVGEGGRFEITSSDKNSLLKIDNIQREDRGEFMVRAWNQLGEDSASFLVTVTARPNPPGRVRLNMSFGKSATLSWTAPVDDGGCKIGNYIVEYFRIGWNVWLKAATTRSLSTTLNDLIEGSEYKFRVKAENPYGLSEPSEESEVLFVPDPKRGITKPKSATKIGDEKEKKPIPPRRKTLSPPRPHADAATGMSPKQSPAVARKPKPQLVDNDELHREMSYGTSDHALKMDIRKSPSLSSADSTPVQKPNSKLNLTVITTTALAPADNQQTMNPSPRASPLKFLKQQTTANPGNKTKRQTPQSAISQPREQPQPQPQSQSQPPPLPQPPASTKLKSSNNPDIPKELERKRSLSPIKKPKPLRKSPTPPEPFKLTPALQRSAEPVQLGVNQHVRRMSGHALSPAKNVPSLVIAIATGGLGSDEPVNPTIEITAPPVATQPPPPPPPEEHKEVTPSWPLNPPESPQLITSDSTPEMTRSMNVKHEKHDEVHTSNEFMLVVFDKNSKVKDKDKDDSFELNLEDAIQPPAISISAPDLAFLEFTNLHTTFPLRRSVSSTELLYERAMARFYEAVELEESAKARKQKTDKDVDKLPAAQAPTTMRMRLGSMTEAERLSFERRSELRRQSADVMLESRHRPWGSRDDLSDIKPLSRTVGMLIGQKSVETERSEDEDRTESTAEDSEEEVGIDDDYEQEERPQPEIEFDMGSDYTESTASSEQDSIEKFKMELMARTHSPSPRELETYHPRNMTAGTFTPYRAPTPEQAAIVLTRPLPLPSPDFVPKPILKRTSTENAEYPAAAAAAGASTADVPASSISTPANLKQELAKGIKSFFSRDKRSTTEKNTEANQLIASPLEKTNAVAIAADVEAKRLAKEKGEQEKKEAERLMMEEAHAAVDHYSDLVREVGSTHKYHTPLYLDRDELKRAAARAAEESGESKMEEDEVNMAAELEKRRVKSSHNDDMLLAPPPVSRERRLSISEREQLVHVRDVASSLAKVPNNDKEPLQKEEEEPEAEEIEYPTVLVVPPPKTKQKNIEEPENLPSEVVEVRPDARGRTRLVKVKRIIKRRVPSSTRSRDSSLNRPPLTLSGDLSVERVSQSSLVLSPSDRSALEKAASLALVQSEEQAHEKVRSALSYSTDLVLFLVACYVYLFKDARLVLPILALMIYRQLGEAITSHIPSWMRRKGNNGS